MNRRHRLRGRGRFAALRAHGVEERAGGLRVRAAGNGLAVSRCGFAVIGARSAVQRNRVRRRLRAATRPLAAALPGLDVLTAVPAAWASRPATDLDRELRRAWSQLELRLLGTAVLS